VCAVGQGIPSFSLDPSLVPFFYRCRHVLNSNGPVLDDFCFNLWTLTSRAWTGSGQW